MNTPSPDSAGLPPSPFTLDRDELFLVWKWAGITAIGMFAFIVNSNFFVLGIAVVAIGQWLLLRSRLKSAAWWLCVTPICLFLGFGLGFSIAGALQDYLDKVASSPLGIAPLEPGRSFSVWLLANVIGNAIGALILGFGQWLVLRRAYKSFMWIPANLIACAAFVPLLFAPALLGQLLAAAWFGAVTGVALVWCLRRSRDSERKYAKTSREWISILVVVAIGSLIIVPTLSQPYIRAIFYETIGDNVQAYELFYIAGTPNGRARVARKMTSAEVAEAERLAKEWLAGHTQK